MANLKRKIQRRRSKRRPGAASSRRMRYEQRLQRIMESLGLTVAVAEKAEQPTARNTLPWKSVEIGLAARELARVLQKHRERLLRQTNAKTALVASRPLSLQPTFGDPQVPVPSQQQTLALTYTLIAIRVSSHVTEGLAIPLYRPLHVPGWSADSYFYQVSGPQKGFVAEMRESTFDEAFFLPGGGCIQVSVSHNLQTADQVPTVRPVDGSITMTAVGERFCEALLLPDRSVIVAQRGHFLRLLNGRKSELLTAHPQVMIEASLLDRDSECLIEAFRCCSHRIPSGLRRQRHWDALCREWLRDGDEATQPLPQYSSISQLLH